MAPSRTLHSCLGLLLLLTPAALITECAAFQTTTGGTALPRPTPLSRLHAQPPLPHPDAPQTPPPPLYPATASAPSTRRAVLSLLVTSTAAVTAGSASAADEDGSFADIAARAARLANQAGSADDRAYSKGEEGRIAKRLEGDDGRSAYDFDLPVAGKNVPFGELIGQTFAPLQEGEEGKTVERKGELVKAILVVNMKQDDPLARKNIPELISLAAKFGMTKEFAVICTPSDQGYYEPDTSELIRLKLASEYGYGLNPATLLTDKVNLLGSGAHPFWRWIEGTCRTPSGLGRVQGNFEKFLVDGRTGRPLRRYPRQYQPLDIAADIDAVIQGKKLPPAGANWKEEWRSADKEAVSDQFRFQKGLNYFDQ